MIFAQTMRPGCEIARADFQHPMDADATVAW
jgi:hypothetical protein